MHMESEVPLGHEFDLLRELWALDHALQRASKKMEKTLGLTGPQRLALRLVSRFPGLPAGRLARLLHLHPSTVSGVVSRLTRRGLIARSVEEPDRRRSLLRITPAGLALLERPQPTVEMLVQASLRTRSAKEVQNALKVITTVTVALEAMSGHRSGEAGA